MLILGSFFNTYNIEYGKNSKITCHDIYNSTNYNNNSIDSCYPLSNFGLEQKKPNLFSICPNVGGNYNTCWNFFCLQMEKK